MIRAILATVIVSACALGASADSVAVQGVLTNGNGGISATGGWNFDGDDNGFRLEYTVSYDADDDLYTYVYEISGEKAGATGFLGLSKGLSNIIIEVSDTFTEDNIFDGTTARYTLRSLAETPSEPIWDFQNVQNPGTNTAGLKWNTIGEVLSATYTIVTDRDPMQGTFFAKDGNDTDATKAASGVLWVPDTTVSGPPPPVPLPGAAVAGVLLLGGTRFGRLLRRRG
jgi:hypothetical protein